MNPYYFNSRAAHLIKIAVSKQLAIPIKDVYKAVKDFVIKDDRAYIQLQNDKLVELTFKK